MNLVAEIGWFDEDHSLMKPDGSFIKLKNIKVRDEIIDINGLPKKVLDVERIKVPNHYQLTIDDKFFNCAFESKLLTKKENGPMEFSIVGYLLLTDNIINFSVQNKFVEGKTTIDPIFNTKNIQAIDFINKHINLVKITTEDNTAYVVHI